MLLTNADGEGQVVDTLSRTHLVDLPRREATSSVLSRWSVSGNPGLLLERQHAGMQGALQGGGQGQQADDISSVVPVNVAEHSLKLLDWRHGSFPVFVHHVCSSFPFSRFIAAIFGVMVPSKCCTGTCRGSLSARMSRPFSVRGVSQASESISQVCTPFSESPSRHPWDCSAWTISRRVRSHVAARPGAGE